METQEYLRINGGKKYSHYSFYKDVTAAAIILLIIICGALYFFQYSKSNDQKIVADFENEINQETKICMDEAIYQISSVTPISDLSAQYKYVGKIKSTVSSNQNPQENLQANANIAGCKVYQFGESIAVNAVGSKEYWIFRKVNDLVYRKYDTGFDVESSDDEEVEVYWNYDKSELKKIYLYAMREDKVKKLSAEEMKDKHITITQSGHYFLYGVDEDGKTIDLTQYVSMEYKDSTHIDSENDSNNVNEPIIGL